MVDLNKILEETLENTWSPRVYPAYSQPPRKDFVAHSSKDSYTYPYQQNQAAGFPPTVPQPPSPSSVPWPLQTINTDLADAFVFLLAAAGKITQCINGNSIMLNQDQKDQLIEMYKTLNNSLKGIKEVGMKLTDVVNMADQPPPQIPVTPTPRIPESQPLL
jgi:hypothetical protein